MKLEYTAMGRDLYADKVECNCLDKRWAVSPEIAHLFKTKISLGGYCDDNFFDNVHKASHESACQACGRKFSFQWFRDGVEFQWKDAK